ncbi:MAG TPA: hypothetical protein VLJ61_07450 [Pyrinomonadaceae bacterium]|nr:hypothetical protein [Pyrinomonadaceae bacterium]
MNSIKLKGFAALFLLLTVGSLQAQARGSGDEILQSEDLKNPVQSGSKTTYFDLLRQMFPDLQTDATAHRTIPFRSISELRKREAVTGDIKFDFKPYQFKSDGKHLLMLWIELRADDANVGTPYEGEADVLAVFQMEPNVKLLDVMDVKTDRFTGFLEDRPLFHLDARSDAFIIYSTHWNAGESYLSVEMLFVDAGRFKSITSLFIYETKGCGANFTEKPDFRAVADPGRKYPKVLVRVKLRKDADEEGCEHPSRGFTRFYRGLYRWNASKGGYASGSRQLDQLEKFNRKRLY